MDVLERRPAGVQSAPRVVGIDLSRLDMRIVRRFLGAAPRDLGFSDAATVLESIVCATIPNGRVFLLSAPGSDPIVGSLRSGVGLRRNGSGAELVRVRGSVIELIRPKALLLR